MEHKHKYDAQGKQLCCTAQEQKIYTDANAKKLLGKHHNEDGHNHEHSDDDGHNHGSTDKSTFQMFLPAIISFALLMIAIAFDNWFPAILVHRLGTNCLVCYSLYSCWISRN